MKEGEKSVIEGDVTTGIEVGVMGLLELDSPLEPPEGWQAVR